MFDELARVPPGPELAAALARVDRSTLNGHQLVEVAKATSRQGGPTTPANLGVLCRHCHRYKHSDGVQLTQPTPSTFIWRARLGHTYTTGPPPPI